MTEQEKERRWYFVLVAIGKGTTHEGINRALKASHEFIPDDYGATWRLWLAGDDTSNMPHDDTSEATKAPIDKNFKSPYANRVRPASLINVVKQASQGTKLNPRYFVVVDERTEKDDSVLLCQININYERDEYIISFRVKAEESAFTLMGAVVQHNFAESAELVRLKKDETGDIL